MKILCSYAFTDENKAKVNDLMRIVVDTLNGHGHDVYCLLFNKENVNLIDTRSIFLHVFKEIKKCDAVVVVKASERRSEGQLMEVGAAISIGKPVYLLQHSLVKCQTHLPELAHKTLYWDTINDLKKALLAI